MPSCMRVPPDAGSARRGSRSAVARRTASTIRAPAVAPIDPPDTPNSLTTKAMGRPQTRPEPVQTDSGSVDRSQLHHVPSSSTASIIAAASGRSLPGRPLPGRSVPICPMMPDAGRSGSQLMFGVHNG